MRTRIALLTGLALFGMTTFSSAATVLGTGHIYNTQLGGVIDDWFFSVDAPGQVSIAVDFVSGSGFDSEIWLLTDNFPGLSGETVVGHDDDDGPGFASYLSLFLAAGDYQVRVSEFSFNNAFMEYEDSVGGDWRYNITISGDTVRAQHSPVPEPGTLLLLGSGLLGLSAARRRK